MKNSAISIFVAYLVLCLFASCELEEKPDDFCKDDFKPKFDTSIVSNDSFATITLINTSEDTSASSQFRWYLDSVLRSSAFDTSFTIPKYGIHTIELRAWNCSGDSINSIKVSQTINFCEDDLIPAFDTIIDMSNFLARVTLKNTSENKTAYTEYEWYLDSGLISSSQDTFFDICKQGKHTITLVSWNCNGDTLPEISKIIDFGEYSTLDCILPFNENGKDIGTKIIATLDGNYVVCGISNDSSSAWIDMIDKNGNRLWNKPPLINELGISEFRDVIEIEGGNYYLACGTDQTPNNGKDIIVAKFDKFGNLIGNIKHYGGAYNDRGSAIIALKDGGYAIAGSSKDSPDTMEDNGDIYVLKLNLQLDSVGSKRVLGTYSDYGYGLQQTESGDILVCGLQGQSNNTSRAVVVKFPLNLSTETVKPHGSNAYRSSFGSIIKMDDGINFLVVGFKTGSNLGDKNVYLTKIDENGNSSNIGLVNESIGNALNDEAYDIFRTHDGFVVVGYSERDSGVALGEPDAYMIKLDKTGKKVWTSTNFEGDAFRRGASVVETPDCGLLIFGTNKEPVGQKDFMLIKTDAGGKCN